MPYILNKTDGTKLTTVDDASLDLSTDLAFVGRNYSGYGQVVNENFLKLLENFSSNTAPTKPIRGQLWYDKANGRLKISYDGKSFKGIASIFVQTTAPLFSALVRGDLWWDSDGFQLRVFDGSRFQTIGPLDPAAGRATWIPGIERIAPDPSVEVTAISKGTVDQDVIAILSKEDFPVQTSSLAEKFTTIKRGITLSYADATGNSANSGTIIWGSAAHSIKADTSTTATFAYNLINGGTPSLVSSSSTNVITYYSTATTATINWSICQRDYNGDIYTNNLIGVATSARYADLAERYHADNVYDRGTVLVIGGTKEVTVTDVQADTSVIGVVSTNPGYMMNSDAGNDETHPFIALKGRVPCKVFGPVKKGELLVTSNTLGHAQAWKFGDSPNAVIGKALEDNLDTFGLIEILVV